MIVMIILLILCLPLILMLSLFTTTNVVSIVVDVPVTGIEVAIEEVIELDLDKGESFTFDYVISPAEASKKDIKVLSSQIGDAKLAEFTVDGNKITPTSYGSALVTVETVDGGFRDSFLIVVYSKRVEGITSTPVKETIVVGEYTKINTVYYPDNVNDTELSYRVKEGEDVVTVSKGGNIRGIGIGTAVIEVTSADNPDAKSEFTVTVESSGVIDFVDDTSYLTALENTGEILSVLNPDVTVLTHSVELFDKDGAPLAGSIADVSFDPLTGKISYSFIDQAFVGEIEVRVTVTPDGGEAVTKSCYINRMSEISIAWKDQGGDGRYSVSTSDPNRIEIDLRPLGANVSYNIKLVYDVKTDVTGDVKSDEAFDLEKNVVYTCQGGYVSIELESTSDGVYLVVRGEYAPTMDEIASDSAVTYIYLTVTNENTGEDTVLAPISVVVY